MLPWWPRLRRELWEGRCCGNEEARAGVNRAGFSGVCDVGLLGLGQLLMTREGWELHDKAKGSFPPRLAPWPDRRLGALEDLRNSVGSNPFVYLTTAGVGFLGLAMSFVSIRKVKGK